MQATVQTPLRAREAWAMRGSFRFSLILVLGMFMTWFMYFQARVDQYSMRHHGVRGVLQPIGDYKTWVKKRSGDRRYTAKLSVRLVTNQTVDIPDADVTLEQINDSREHQLELMVVPDHPQVYYFVGHEPDPENILPLCIGFTLGTWWFLIRDPAPKRVVARRR